MTSELTIIKETFIHCQNHVTHSTQLIFIDAHKVLFIRFLCLFMIFVLIFVIVIVYWLIVTKYKKGFRDVTLICVDHL